MDTSDPKQWSHPQKIGKNANCPACGYDGGGHVTVFVEGQIGRRCLECGSTWPIQLEERGEEPQPTPSRPDFVTCVLAEKKGSREGLCGRVLGFDFAFVSQQHAESSEAAGSYIVLCEDCRNIMNRKDPT
jgi:hypothetical protein